jgi:hypothetical protein
MTDVDRGLDLLGYDELGRYDPDRDTSPDAPRRAPVVQATTPKLRVLDVEHMLATEPPPVPWVVEPLLVAGCVTMLAGREGPDGCCTSTLRTGSAKRTAVSAASA